MAVARIRSAVTSKPTIDGASRNDLVNGDVVTLTAVQMCTTYAWTIAYVPEGSAVTTASLTDPTLQNPGSFTVDVDGSYLVRLEVTAPKITVTSDTIAAGSSITINGVVLTGVVGARTPGGDNFSVDGANIAAHTLEIASAINDGANSFAATIATADDASPDVALNPLVPLTVSAFGFTVGVLETEQFVRLRALTAFGSLQLVAAGERYDTISVPVDVTPAGWADEQNFNLNTLLGYAKTTEASTRLLFVDPVAGDYQTIQAAIDYAVSQTPTLDLPWTIVIRPGRYSEGLNLAPYVNLIAWPGTDSSDIVVVDCDSANHSLNLAPVGSTATFINIVFTRDAVGALACMSVVASDQSSQAKFVRCRFEHGGGGPAVEASSCSVVLADCYLQGGTLAGDYALRLYEAGGIGANVHVRDCDITGDQGILIERQIGATSSQLTTMGCFFDNVGTNSITANGPANFYMSVWNGSATTDIAANPSGVVITGDLTVHAAYCQFGAASVDDTGVTGTTQFGLGACSHGTLTTAGTATFSANVDADSIFYDNTTSGIAAEDVQAALDEIYAYAALVRTLDDAYDGGVAASGSGRTIVADAGSVQIVDAAAPSPTPPAGNTHGNLEVVGSVSIGGIGSPEILLDPNPFGSGPLLQMGNLIWNGSAAYGSSAFIEAYSTRDPSYHNYNLTLTSTPTDGGGQVGSIIVRGGVGLDGIKIDPSGGHVHLLGGEAGGDTVSADGGSVYIAPGGANGGSAGSIYIGRAQSATSATLTAAGAATDPLGVSGDITIGTDMGTVTVSLDAADNLASVLSKLTTSAPTVDPAVFFTATEAAGVITLTTVTKGPTAQIFWVSSDAGVDAALGTFSTQAQTNGTWPDQIDVAVSAANEISFGPSGATGPLVYNADTGKLTVPGVIDPTGMIYTESTLTNLTLPANGWTGSGIGGLYVSDGTDGQDNNHLYYVLESGTPIKLSGGGTGTVVGPGTSTDNALARYDGVTGQILEDSVGILNDSGELSGLAKVTATDLAIVTAAAPTIGQVLAAADTSGNVEWVTPGSGSGDVVGPASSTDNALARFHLGTGKEVQNSVGILTDLGDLSGLAKVTTTELAVVTATPPAVGRPLVALDVAGNVGWANTPYGDVSSILTGTPITNQIAVVTDATAKEITNSLAAIDGIGNISSPQNIQGNSLSSTTLTNTATLRVTTGAIANHVLTSDGIGNATWAAPTAGTVESVYSGFDWVGAGTTMVTDLTTLNSGDVVLQIWIRFSTAFLDSTSTVEVSENGGSFELVPKADINPSSNTLSAWAYDPVYLHNGASSDLQITVVSAAGETQGEGFIVALVHRA